MERGECVSDATIIGIVDLLTEQAAINMCGDLYVFVRNVIPYSEEGDGSSLGRRVQEFNFIAQSALGQD